MGGAEFVVKQHIELLSKRYKVDFYTSTDSDTPRMENVNFIKSANQSKYFYKNCSDFKRAPGSFKKNFDKEVKQLVSMNDYDLIMSHTYEYYGPSIMSKISHKNKCIHIEHGCKEARGGMGLFAFYKSCKEMKENGGRLLTVSEYAKNDLNEYCKKKFDWKFDLFSDVIYAYIANIEWFNETIEDYICMIARIDPVKNISLALQFFEANPDIKGKLCTNYWKGNKLYDAYFDSMYSKYGKLSNLEWVINAPREKVLDIVSKARLFLHTSPNENFSVVIGEALNHGLPVVVCSKKHGKHGWNEIDRFEDEIITVPLTKKKENLENLKIAINLDRKYDLDKKKLIRNKILTRFSTESFYDKIDSFIK